MLNPALLADSPELESSWQTPRLALAGGSDVPPREGNASTARSAEVIDLAAARRAREAPEQQTSRNGPRVRIYRPGRSVTQSGTANTKRWVLEFEPTAAPTLEPLMGWTSGTDTPQQIRLYFASKDQAIAFAERRGWSYTVREPRERAVMPDYKLGDDLDLALFALGA